MFYLQNHTPKGGHVPYAPNGERCSFNSYAQLHERLPFVSERTIKSRIKAMTDSLTGFDKIRVEGHSSNHYFISPDLALELDLSCSGKKLFFHEKEAIHHGILEAILLQRLGYTCAALSNPLKKPQPIDPRVQYKLFAHSKRTVTRALERLLKVGGQGSTLLKINQNGTFAINEWVRARFIEFMEKPPEPQPVKVAQAPSQSCTSIKPKLHSPLPKLHRRDGERDAASLDLWTLETDAALLNNLQVIQSTRKIETAGRGQLFSVPLVPEGDQSIDQQSLETAASPSPSKASPATITVSTSATSSSAETCNAKREMAMPATQTVSASHVHESSVTAAAKPEPSSGNICEPVQGHSSGIISRSNIMPEATPVCVYNLPPPIRIPNLIKEERHMLRLFHDFSNELELVPDGDTDGNFLAEIRNNPEFGPDELLMVFQSVKVAEKMHLARSFEGKFNPSYHSCRLSTSNQWIAKFYLILTDRYRMSPKEFFQKGRPANQLRDDTPAHIRRYIERKVAGRQS